MEVGPREKTVRADHGIGEFRELPTATFVTIEIGCAFKDIGFARRQPGRHKLKLARGTCGHGQ